VLNIILWNINAGEQCKWNDWYDDAIEKYIGEACETNNGNNENIRGSKSQERWWCRITPDREAWNASVRRKHETRRLDPRKVLVMMCCSV